MSDRTDVDLAPDLRLAIAASVRLHREAARQAKRRASSGRPQDRCAGDLPGKSAWTWVAEEHAKAADDLERWTGAGTPRRQGT